MSACKASSVRRLYSLARHFEGVAHSSDKYLFNHKALRFQQTSSEKPSEKEIGESSEQKQGFSKTKIEVLKKKKSHFHAMEGQSTAGIIGKY